MKQIKWLIDQWLQVLWQQIFRVVKLWGQHNIGFKCAGLTYYAMFAVIPLLSLLITISTIFITKDFVAEKVNFYLTQVFSGPVLLRLQSFVNSLIGSDYSLALSIGGMVIFLYATTTYFYHLNQTVRNVAEMKTSSNGLVENIRSRVLGVGQAVVIFLGLVTFSGIQILLQVTDQVLTYVIDSEFIIAILWLVGLISIIAVLSAILAIYYRMILGQITSWSRLLLHTSAASLVGFIINKSLAQMLSFSAAYQDYGIFSATLSVMVWIFLANAILLITAGLLKDETDRSV